MKVIITKQNQDGSYNEVGMNNRFLSTSFKTVTGLLERGMPYKDCTVRLELFRENLYVDPYEVKYVKV